MPLTKRKLILISCIGVILAEGVFIRSQLARLEALSRAVPVAKEINNNLSTLKQLANISRDSSTAASKSNPSQQKKGLKVSFVGKTIVGELLTPAEFAAYQKEKALTDSAEMTRVKQLEATADLKIRYQGLIARLQLSEEKSPKLVELL